MKLNLTDRRLAVAIVALFALLGTIYSMVTPIFEASDEFLHYPFVEYVATTGQLPVQQPGVETMWDQEGSQPPLYYLLSAGLTSWIDTSDLETVRWRNPHGKLGIPLDPDNKNIIIHTPAEAFPWSGTVLAVHIIRLFSVALGTVSVTLTYVLTRTVWPDRRWIAILATALTAFNPMFLFITGSVNNDNLMILLGTWTLLLAIRVLKEGLTLQRSITLAIVLAAGALTKISGLTLLPLVALALLFYAWRSGDWRGAILTGLGILLATAVIAGWWYLRNLRLYGELLGLDTMVAIAGPREPITLWELRREWYGFWVAYWALFGGVSILADPIVFRFLEVLSVVAVAGLVWWVVGTIRHRAWDDLLIPGLLLVQVAVTSVGLVRWTLMTYGSQGRLMFPIIAAISALLALGLLNWIPERWRPTVSGVAAIPLLGVAIISPFRYIAPAYAPPPTVDTVPTDATPVGLHFGDLEIVALGTEDITTEEDGWVPVTVYLRANAPITSNLSLYLHALGRDAEEIGKIDTYPGGGSLPTTAMEPSLIYADHYSIGLDEQFTTPTAVHVAVGVGEFDGEQYVIHNGTLDDSSEQTAAFVTAGVAYPTDEATCTQAIPANPSITASIGGFARLWVNAPPTSVAAGESLAIPLVWDRLDGTDVNWTVFVHLADATGNVVAQSDGPPLNGDYPTNLWRQPCAFEDVHIIDVPADLPAGNYHLLAGMYDASDPGFARAPAADEAGVPYPNNAVPLGEIEVSAP